MAHSMDSHNAGKDDCLYRTQAYWKTANSHGTGEWVNGQSKVVDAAIAFKMLRHPDVYQDGGLLLMVMADPGHYAETHGTRA